MKKDAKPWEFETLKHVKMQKQSVSRERFPTAGMNMHGFE